MFHDSVMRAFLSVCTSVIDLRHVIKVRRKRIEEHALWFNFTKKGEISAGSR